MARLVTATPGLRAAGLITVATLAAAAVAASRTAEAVGPFLVVAPLAPLTAVAAAFAPMLDPAGEAGVATPLHGAGLVMRRAAVLLAVTFGLLGIGALAVPGLGSAAAAWVLPALALALAALALATWMRIDTAVGGLALAWLTGVWTAWWAGGRAPVADASVFAAGGQAVALGIVLAAGATLIRRRHHFATLEAFR